MFETFKTRYVMTAAGEQPGGRTAAFDYAPLERLFEAFSGASFDHGIYRIHRADRIGHWNERVGEGFPELRDRIVCFGFDWLGRQFALDRDRVEGGEPLVLMIEPGTGEILEIPSTLERFHDSDLIELADAALAADFFALWLESGGKAPRHDECVGYRQPLFLGGEDDLDNLELTDMEVYWGLYAQLLDRVRGLPPGTPVSSIGIG